MRITLDASRIRFEAIDDKQAINHLVTDEYVAQGINDDLLQFEYSNDPNVKYIGVFVDDDFAGAYLTIKLSDIEYETHVALYKEYKYYGRQLSKMYIDYMFSLGVKRLTTYIPDFNRSVVNMCLKIGFKYEGFMRKCVIKNGVIYGRHVLGVCNE